MRLAASTDDPLFGPDEFEAGIVYGPVRGEGLKPVNRHAFLKLAYVSDSRWAAVDGLGVALGSTRLAGRGIASGRLVEPLIGRACNIRHRLVHPRTGAQRRTVRVFAEWLVPTLRETDPLL